MVTSGAVRTVSRAEALVAGPQGATPPTITLYRYPSSPVTSLMLRVDVVAPLYIPPLITLFHVTPPSVLTCHWKVRPLVVVTLKKVPTTIPPGRGVHIVSFTGSLVTTAGASILTSCSADAVPHPPFMV